jgi:hypothetical protein
MNDINEKWGYTSCQRCKKQKHPSELNAEARHHHGALEVICLDRKSCERNVKKLKKKSR